MHNSKADEFFYSLFKSLSAIDCNALPEAHYVYVKLHVCCRSTDALTKPPIQLRLVLVSSFLPHIDTQCVWRRGMQDYREGVKCTAVCVVVRLVWFEMVAA